MTPDHIVAKSWCACTRFRLAQMCVEHMKPGSAIINVRACPLWHCHDRVAGSMAARDTRAKVAQHDPVCHAVLCVVVASGTSLGTVPNEMLGVLHHTGFAHDGPSVHQLGKCR